MSSQYMILIRSAKMPSSCWGKYGKVAVVEIEEGFDKEPKMISERARGVKRIVELWDRVHIGKGVRDEMSQVLKEAKELKGELESSNESMRDAS